MNCPLKKDIKSSDSIDSASLKSTNTTSTVATKELSPVLTGSCLCGNVKYTSTTLPEYFTNCHCSTCRRLSSAPFMTFGGYPRSAITFCGPSQPTSTSFTDFAVRLHCADCGGQLGMRYLCEPESIHMTAGTIEEQSVKGKLPKVKHCIFVPEAKGMWYDVGVDEKIPRYRGFRSEFQKAIDDWRRVFLQPGLG